MHNKRQTLLGCSALAFTGQTTNDNRKRKRKHDIGKSNHKKYRKKPSGITFLGQHDGLKA